MDAFRTMWPLAVLVLASGCVDPADIIVYVTELPAFFRVSSTRSPEPFQTPFNDATEPGDPQTRIMVKSGGGVRIPDGTLPYAHVSWGKYVLVAHHGGSGPQGQHVGIFDTETRRFCDLAVKPTSGAGVAWLDAATPALRQTRIYFGGTVGDGDEFGWIDADMDTADPCDPVTGWHVTGYTAQQVDCAAAGLQPECSADDVCVAAGQAPGCSWTTLPARMNPCPRFSEAGISISSCFLDGMTALDAEHVVLANYIFGRLIVVRVDGTGTMSVADVYQTQNWNGPSSSTPCYGLFPVQRPIADHTRTTSCTVSSAACTTDADCAGGGGSCRPDLRWTSVYDHLVPLPGCPPPQGRAAQEFRFDGIGITATSDPFLPPQGGFTPTGPYDAQGNLWLSGVGSCSGSGAACSAGTCPSGQTCQPSIAVYQRIGTGHAYDHAHNPSGAALVAPEQRVPFESWNIFSLPAGLQVGTRMYVSSREALQRATYADGWSADPAFKLTIGASKLPAKAGHCSVSNAFCGKSAECGPSGGACRFDCVTSLAAQPSGSKCDDQGLSCPSGQICVEIAGYSPNYNLSAGGSPPSLWMLLGFMANGPKNAYLARMPLSTAISDSLATSRPAIAWSGGDCAANPKQCRLWMVAERGGGMQYRVRDDGFWSSWYALPSGPVAGGPAIVATYGSVLEVFARGASDGVVRRLALGSPITCDPGSCTWSSWSSLPSAVTTTSDVSATATPTGAFVVIRGSDANVWYSRRNGGAFTPWTSVPGVTTDAAPSATYRAASSGVHIAVRDATNGAITVALIATGTTPSWQAVTASAHAPWATAPAIVDSNGYLQVFAAAPGSPPLLYEAMNGGGGFGNWRALRSEGTTIRQPAVTDAHGDVNLVSSLAAGMSEESPQ